METKSKLLYIALFVCGAFLIVVLKVLFFGNTPDPTHSPVDDYDRSALAFEGTDREIRGVWIASVFNINFPSAKNLDTEVLKAEIDDIVNTATENGLNTICFQVRPSCDALYRSSVFSVSTVLSTDRVLPDGFDPLEYIIETAHAKDIAIYAWINPFRVTASKTESKEEALASLSEASPAAMHPDYCIFYNGQLWFNPAIPAVREIVSRGVREIVDGYSVDGVIFDDYFYPYPVEGENFDDADAYASYGGGLELGDFRRECVNSLVKSCFEAVKSAETPCAFGVAPFGIWRNSSTDPRGSDTAGFQAYDSLYCDALAWIRGGYVDFISPQLYWQFTNAKASYSVLLDWWNKQLEGSDVKLVVSHGAYNSADWGTAGEIENQIIAARDKNAYFGSLQYGYAAIKENDMNLSGQLTAVYSDEIIYSSKFTDESETAAKFTANGTSDGEP